MPRVPLHALIWSASQRLYEVYTQGHLVLRLQPTDHRAWQSWLRDVTSLSFQCPSGSLNVYCEARRRGSQYWYAYHTHRGRTRKRYLGSIAQVSLARLEETAHSLAIASECRPEPIAASSLVRAPRTELDQMVVLTKLAPPCLSTSLVQRDRLLAALDGALSIPLTLLAASDGWGKTTLLATWASKHPRQVAWLSLDGLDNDPIRFWAAVMMALRTRVPGVGTVSLVKRTSRSVRCARRDECDRGPSAVREHLRPGFSAGHRVRREYLRRP
jgi:LuxR family transcriptional regulator, maltose regulon positive regulatory protein